MIDKKHMLYFHNYGYYEHHSDYKPVKMWNLNCQQIESNLTLWLMGGQLLKRKEDRNICTTYQRTGNSTRLSECFIKMNYLSIRAAQYRYFLINSISIILYPFLSIPISISIISKRAYQYQYLINYLKLHLSIPISISIHWYWPSYQYAYQYFKCFKQGYS